MNAANQAVAAAIFAGLELRAVQANLKKYSKCTFEEFLDEHLDVLGFWALHRVSSTRSWRMASRRS